ncbi:MAG: C25 family cysteine peptidase [Phycisphaerae bacterium]|nr:C25 family cysteine peptidase [Phycisphaerae bacterium]
MSNPVAAVWSGVLPVAILWLATPGCVGDAAEDPRAEIAEAQIGVIESDNKGMEVMLAFGLPTMETVEAGGETWTRLRIAGLEDAGEGDGYPCIPVCRRLFAVPQGAEVSLASVTPVAVEHRQLHLYPFQALEGEFPTDIDLYTDRLPPPDIYISPSFTKDPQAYQQDRPHPLQPCSVRKLGSARDLEIAVLECACGQYNPVTDRMTFWSSIDAKIEFSGGSGSFLPERSENPFDNSRSAAAQVVLNHDVIDDYLPGNAPIATSMGEEYLILTHPRYRQQADELADWKRDQGIITRVVEVNDGDGPGPDTQSEIDAFIDDHYNNARVRPAYLLLFGDHEDIPTWIMQRLNKDPGVTLATDLPYAQVNTSPDPYHLDFFPDLALGRIPVNTVEQAQTVVDKIIAYESVPPQLEDGATVFQRGPEVTIAGSFECCWEEAPYDGWEYNHFVYNAERVRSEIASQGYTVERIYNTFTSHHPDYAGDPTPRYFGTGEPLPYDLGPGSGFAWDGNTQDVIDAFNHGRMLFFYFDHGGSTGWSLPRLTNHNPNNLPSLVNADALPVVFCMNCSSGAIDLDYGFAEDLLRLSGGGAIGVVAFTRMANAGLLGHVALGGIDALWPDVLPDFGGTTAKHRLGDIFNHAKAHLASQAGTYDPDDEQKAKYYLNTLNHVRLLQLAGDPTLSVWTASPVNLPGDVFLIPEYDDLRLHYPVDGAVITAVENTGRDFVPIGRGVVTDGVASLALFNVPEDLSLVQFSASYDNAASTVLTLTNEPTAEIIEPFPDASFVERDTITFRGESQDKFGQPLPESSVQWRSDMDGLLGVGHEIETMLSEGTHEITFQAIDKDGSTATDTLTLLVAPGPENLLPSVTIDDPASDVTYDVVGVGSLEITLVGSAMDQEDGELTGDSLVWVQVSAAGGEVVMGTGNTLTVTLEVAAGVACIEKVYQFKLIATDSRGEPSEAVRTITLKPC